MGIWKYYLELSEQVVLGSKEREEEKEGEEEMEGYQPVMVLRPTAAAGPRGAVPFLDQVE